MSDAASGPVRLSFNPQLRVEFRGATVTSDAGLLLPREIGNLLRRLVLPDAVQSWSLTSLQQRLFKTGGGLIRHARHVILQLAESYLTQSLFQQMVARIEQLAWHPT